MSPDALCARVAVQRHRRWARYVELSGVARLVTDQALLWALGRPDYLPACPLCRRPLDRSWRVSLRELGEARSQELAGLATALISAAGGPRPGQVPRLLLLMLSEKLRNGLRNLCLRWPWLLRPALARALFSPAAALAALGRPDPLAGRCLVCLRPPAAALPAVPAVSEVPAVPAFPEAPTIAEAIAEHKARLARAEFEVEWFCHALRAHALTIEEVNAELARNRPAAEAFARLHPEMLEGTPA